LHHQLEFMCVLAVWIHRCIGAEGNLHTRFVGRPAVARILGPMAKALAAT
jgi:hypothetical protein